MLLRLTACAALFAARDGVFAGEPGSRGPQGPEGEFVEASHGMQGLV